MTKLPRLLAALFALALVAAACSSDGDDTSTEDGAETDETTESTDAAADEGEGEAEVAAPELSVTAVSFADSTVTIRNDGAEAVSLDGYFLCNRPAYADLPSVTIEPGATVDIDASTVSIEATSGEFGIYSSQNFENAADLHAYVQWGGAANGRAPVAVEAGLIAEGEFVDNGGEDFTVG